MITVFRPIWVDEIWPLQVFQPRIEGYFAIGVLQPYLELYFSAWPFLDPCDATDMAHILGVYKNVRRLTDRYFSCASRRLLGIGGREDMPSANVNANIGAARMPLSPRRRESGSSEHSCVMRYTVDYFRLTSRSGRHPFQRTSSSIYFFAG